MALYLDSSALLKRYVTEPETAMVERQLQADQVWFTARVTLVEVRRNLKRALSDASLTDSRERFARDWSRLHVLELDEQTSEIAAGISEATGVRTLDALHLAAATRVGKGALTFFTFDVRQAQIARTLGFSVLGA